jgi:predicted restriction endonuclease
MPRDNIGDIMFIHNTKKGTKKNYPDGIYFICEIVSKIYYNDNYDMKSIDLKVLKSFKQNPIKLDKVGFGDISSNINKLGSNGAVYKFKNEENPQKLYNLLMKQTIDSLTEDIKIIFSSNKDNNTETQSNIITRLGQGQFREDLITYWGGCSITNYKMVNILIASHIKPWKDASNDERLDVYNGLLLLPNIDKLFDKGYISFDDNGKIIISKDIQDIKILGIDKNMKINIKTKHKKYLQYHRDKIFLDNKC